MQSRASMDPLFLQIPQLHVRTDSYKELGYVMGRTIKSLINDSVSKVNYLNEKLIPAYASNKGKLIYDHALELCKQKYPHYVEELQGMALGCDIPFFKLFLLHVDTLICSSNPEDTTPDSNLLPFQGITAGRGCTDILSFLSNKQALLAHNEDGSSAMRNNVFVLSAEIVDTANPGIFIEKFTTLVYAGFLPGGTMGFNEHGIIHSMNTMVPLKTITTGTPTLFTMRALLSAKSLSQFVDILKDEGTGCGDGSSLNVIYIKDPSTAPRVVNIECAPNYGAQESKISIHKIRLGESYEHCNRYLRIEIQENDMLTSSSSRHGAITKYNARKPYAYSTICEILSDKSGGDYPIYRNADSSSCDKGYTLLVGIADTESRLWSLYVGPPSTNKPLVQIPIKFIFDK